MPGNYALGVMCTVIHTYICVALVSAMHGRLYIVHSPLENKDRFARLQPDRYMFVLGMK